VVTLQNYFKLFNGLLNPKQLEGLRLLLTPFRSSSSTPPMDRPIAEAEHGRDLFECHVNGHTNNATHLVGDIRPQEFRHRLDTPSLRGVNVQRFVRLPTGAAERGRLHRVRAAAALLRRRSGDCHQEGREHPGARQPGPFMAEFMAILDFPPAPKLDLFGKLDPKMASPAELAGQKVFFERGRCADVTAGALLHRQLDAQPAHRAVLPAAPVQWPHGQRRRGASRRSRCGASRTRRPTCTTDAF